LEEEEEDDDGDGDVDAVLLLLLLLLGLLHGPRWLALVCDAETSDGGAAAVAPVGVVLWVLAVLAVRPVPLVEDVVFDDDDDVGPDPFLFSQPYPDDDDDDAAAAPAEPESVTVVLVGSYGSYQARLFLCLLLAPGALGLLLLLLCSQPYPAGAAAGPEFFVLLFTSYGSYHALLPLLAAFLPPAAGPGLPPPGIWLYQACWRAVCSFVLLPVVVECVLL
jgi:hypothetical protein